MIKEYLLRIGKERFVDKFDKLYEHLIEKNKLFNLTSIIERDEVEKKHFIDSLLAEPYISVGASILDIGTGAGFPTLPLAIIREDLSFTAIDSVNKKIGYVNETAHALGLNNVSAVHIRAEDLDKKIKYDYALTRAVAKLNVLCEYCLPFVKVGGKMIAYKSDNIDEEITESKNALNILGGKIDNIIEERIEGTDINRKLVIIIKEKESPSIYPRNGNKPRLKPL